MKNVVILCMLLVSVKSTAQVADNTFAEAFEGMFQYEEPVWIPQDTPPDPPVHLDGGIIALLTAGGAVAYKKYKSKRGQ